MDEHLSSLEDYFIENPLRSAREAQEAIERLTGTSSPFRQPWPFFYQEGAD